MPGPQPGYSREEFARRGEQIFERDIRPTLSGARDEDFVLIDVETGDYEIDAADIVALHRLLARRPDAQVWMRRVGSPYAHRLGLRRGSAAR
jgi:hypothetical protein